MTAFRLRIRDGKEQMQLRCPSCKTWGDVDKDQAEGLVSCICPGCGAHWTVEDEGIHLDVRVDE